MPAAKIQTTDAEVQELLRHAPELSCGKQS
jgi:hypothetical protein